MFRINFLWIAVDHKAINPVYRREKKNMSQTENEKKEISSKKGKGWDTQGRKYSTFF